MNRLPTILLAALTLATSPAWAGGIPDGTYLCKAGNARMMLTLGEITIKGDGYSFHPPTGPDTSGTYRDTGTGFQWYGDIGAITNAQIVESKLDALPNAFWFTYRVGTSSPTPASCTM